MKILILILLYSFNSLACKNSVPESEAARYINANGVGVTGLYECKDKPLEKCHCFDNLGAWETLKLADNVVLDYVSKVDEQSCQSEIDCDNAFSSLVCKQGTAIKNYETLSIYCAVDVMKVDGKKLVENKEKKAAFLAVKSTQDTEIKNKENKKKSAKEALKSIDIAGATTIVKLKEIVKALLEAQE